jgi:hypothetical protein
VPRDLVFYCLILYSRDSKLNREVADYVGRRHEALDDLFGPRLHGFALGYPPGKKHQHRAAGASDRCAALPARRRLDRLQRELRDARRNVYGERAPTGKSLQRIADDTETLSRIARNGKTVAAVLAPVVTFAFGGTGVLGP